MRKKGTDHSAEGPSEKVLTDLMQDFRAGRLEKVKTAAFNLTEKFPAFGFGWKILSVTLKRTEGAAASLDASKRYVTIEPEDPGAHLNLGNTLKDLGRLDESEISYKQAIRLKPDLADAHNNLGTLLLELGRLDEAELSFRNAIKYNPGFPAAHFNLGITLKEKGRLEDAKVSYTQGTVLNPDYFEAYNNLGIVQKDLGELEASLLSFSRAIELRPDLADPYYNLANALKKLGRLKDAEVSLTKAIELRPGFAEAHNNLGTTLLGLDRFSEAEASFRVAIALDPNFADSYSNLSIAIQNRYRFVSSLEYLDQAITLRSDSPHALQRKATLLSYMSDFREVTSLSDSALELAEGDDLPSIWQQRLYLWIYHPDLSAEEIRDEHIKWGNQYGSIGQMDFRDHDRDPLRRLKIGYVSPDFRGHTCRFYFNPLFSFHNHEKVELFAYSNVLMEDEHTSQMKTYFDVWRDIRELSDEAVAEIVRQDKIDILVDGCGHMRDTRLEVFGHKPAPIQVTWLGSAWTTGLPQMDYALFDQHMAPEGTATSEEIVRLPRTWAAFQPGDRAMQSVVKPLPASSNGYVTFGYTGRTERLNYKVFNVWARILGRLPQARLILDYRPFTDPETQDYFRGFLEEHGVDTARVIMRYSTDIFEGLGDIDILLDSFPHSGGTMLFDAVWMGVPAVTLASSRPVGRIGTSLMHNLGLPDWVSNSEKEYEDRAVAFAQDIAALSELRTTMRERMQTSPIMDGRSFAQDVENAYQKMWQKWISI